MFINEKPFNTTFRKGIAKKYFRELYNDFLNLIGYNQNIIIEEINNINSKNLGVLDFSQYTISNIYKKFKVKFQVQSGKKLFTKNQEKSIDT